jgi:hypothetical protein
MAWGGINPETLMGLYGIYCRPIIEYGSMVFVQISKTAMASLQKMQNDAMKICLRLPQYISIATLHKSACLPRIDERLLQIGSKLLAKLEANNGLITDLTNKKGEVAHLRSHRSPLDVLRPSLIITEHFLTQDGAARLIWWKA